MEENEIELRGRLKRAAGQIQSQHRRLEPLFEDLSRALASRTSRDSQTAAFRLDGAIKAHFLLEEKIIFPAIHGLPSQHHDELEALAEDHRGLGAALQAVIDQILEERLDLAAQSLEKFWLAIRDHEYREEAFLNTLDSAPSNRNL
jgi:iron-sulfur cluster repair protein YtfE (RIC family)